MVCICSGVSVGLLWVFVGGFGWVKLGCQLVVVVVVAERERERERREEEHKRRESQKEERENNGGLKMFGDQVVFMDQFGQF